MEDIEKGKRFRLGILFNFKSSWMGGVIYLLNIIKILDLLDDERKPEIFIFYRSDLRKYIDEIDYPYLKAIEWRHPSVYKGYLVSWIYRRNIFVNEILNKFNLDGLYPLHDYPVKTETKTKLVCWYADLQHKYFPEFFTRRKIIERNTRIKFMLRNSHDLVVSSEAVRDDFTNFFRLHNKLNIHIFHFVSFVDTLDGMDIKELKSKFKLPAKYFIISNQFHKHKNHKILFQSLALLKEKNVFIHLALTGKFPDATNSPYINDIFELIEKHYLHNQVSFLGVISRKEQLLLMKYSQAVIQPSLFEGWSTVIEDAKSLQVPVIASNLKVNIEQLGINGVYFDPNSPDELATLLFDIKERNIKDIFYDDYTKRIKAAAENFIKIFL